MHWTIAPSRISDGKGSPEKNENTDISFWLGFRYTSMYLRADADSHNAIPILPDFYLVHLIFGFFPSLDVLFRPINVASSICGL